MRVDFYTFQARLRPTLLVLLPLPVTAVAWLSDQFLGWGTLATLLTWFGITTLLAQLGRDLGKQKEPTLFASWGGTPTTRKLRHRDTDIDPVTLSRYHKTLSALVRTDLPSAEQEQADPTAADHAYDSCVRYLRENTRDRERFPLVYAEVVNYGFRRNLWAMKGGGMFLAAAGFIACAAALLVGENGSVNALAMPATVVNAVMLTWWALRITPTWVRTTADAYAERLLASCDILQPPKRP
jgi:hypothetical protein